MGEPPSLSTGASEVVASKTAPSAPELGPPSAGCAVPSRPLKSVASEQHTSAAARAAAIPSVVLSRIIEAYTVNEC
jgi:hypothetical protein